MNMHSMGCTLCIRCALSTRKYGNLIITKLLLSKKFILKTYINNNIDLQRTPILQRISSIYHNSPATAITSTSKYKARKKEIKRERKKEKKKKKPRNQKPQSAQK
jgi:hypothetical protein